MEASAWDPEGVDAVLDPSGRLLDEAASSGLDAKDLYKRMVAARALDLRLSRAELPMWVSSAGEEAPLVLSALLAEIHDWIYPGPRDAVVALARGLDPAEIARQVLGRTSAETKGRSLPGHVSSTAHRVAATTDALGLHLPLAAGEAHGQKLAGHGHVTLALFGEGLTTTGVFHETTSLAVTCDLPLVLVCKSQIWPEGAPVEAGLLGDSVAERARASGLWARRADGGDPFDVYRALQTALERARQGGGPALVECIVTQMRFDPPAHRDPIERLRRHLDAKGEWSSTFQDVVEAEVRGRINKAFETVESPA